MKKKANLGRFRPKKEGLASFFNVNEPTPKTKEIRSDGKVGIAFNNRMLLPDDFLSIVQQSRLRALEDEDAPPPLIEIISKPGEDSDLDKLGLNWEITGFTEKSLDIKLVYVNPLEVSQNDMPDVVKVIVNLSRFTDEFGQSMADGTILEIEVPRQV